LLHHAGAFILFACVHKVVEFKLCLNSNRFVLLGNRIEIERRTQPKTPATGPALHSAGPAPYPHGPAGSSAQPSTTQRPASPAPRACFLSACRARTLPPTDRAGPPVSAPPWQPARQQPNSPSPPGSRNGAQRSPIPGPRVGLSSMPSGPRASVRALTPLRRHLGPTPSASPCSVPRRVNQRPLLSHCAPGPPVGSSCYLAQRPAQSPPRSPQPSHPSFLAETHGPCPLNTPRPPVPPLIHQCHLEP